MPTLYQISEDLRIIESLLMEVGGDVTDEQANKAIEEWFAEAEGELDAKTDRYCRFIRELEAKAEARKKEADRLAQLASVNANAAKHLKARLYFFMLDHKMKLIETDSFKVTIAGNGGVLPLCITGEPDQLPMWARHTFYQADGPRIRQSLDRGETLKFASYGERGTHLRIR